MLYALILTTYMFYPNPGNVYSVAVAQTSTPGFTTEQACQNAGQVAIKGSPKELGKHRVATIYQCAPLNL